MAKTLASPLPNDPAHLHAILGALPGNFILLRPDAPTYTIVAMSAELLAQTGREAAQIVGQSVFVAYPENEAEAANSGPAQMRTALDASLRDHQPHELPLVRYDVPAPDGTFEERYWSGRSQAILDAQGHVLYLLFTSVDRTTQQHAEREQQARQQAEQRAQELEARVQERTRQIHEQGQRLERLFQQAPAAICILSGPDLVYELVNPIYQQFFPERQLLGKPLLEALPELTDHAAYHTMRRVFDSGEAVSQQALHTPLARTADGVLEDRYFNYVQQPRYDEQGQVDGVLVFGFEVTELVHARQQAEALQAQVLAEAQRRGQERETFYRIFEQAPALVALLRSPSHRYEYVNPAYQALFPGRELVSRDMAEAVPEMAEQGFVDLLDQVYRSGETYFGQEMAFTPQLTTGEAPRTTCYNFTFQAYREEGEVAGMSIFAFEVTDQVLARRDREAQREQLHKLFMQAPVPICILDGPALVFQLVNPAYQRIFPGRALLGKPLLTALPEVVGTAVHALLQGVYDTGETYVANEMPLQMARAEGAPREEISFTFTFQARRSASGAVDGVLVFTQDVTEQVRARRVVEESEQQVRTMVENAPFLMGMYVGPELRFHLANQAMLDGLGKEPDVIGKRYADVVPEMEHHGVFEQMQQVMATGEALHLRNQQLEVVMHGTPETFYYNYSFIPLRNGAGEVYGILNTAVDVTDLVLARQRLESYAAELKESEARFRTMADAAPNMVWAVHPDSSIRYINRAFLDFVGLDTEQQYIATGWTPYLHPDELELTQHTLTQAIAQRQPYVLEHRMRRYDGQYRWLLAQGAPSYLATGELYGYVGSAIDITALKQTNEQLQRTNQDLDNFVYAASHDLKQPVNNLVGLFEELRRGSTFADPAEEQLLVPLVSEALQQLSITIDDLAALGQAQQTSLAPPELVSLDDLTEEVVNTLEPQVRAARARITTDFTSRPALSFARANLRIILLNLLGNSLKYADPARPARIHVSVWVEQGQAVLVVEDNGLGFDADKHGAELFQLFRRLHTHTPGTGVGLYLVHRIVEANGGSIEVDSQPGEGATFRIRLGMP